MHGLSASDSALCELVAVPLRFLQAYHGVPSYFPGGYIGKFMMIYNTETRVVYQSSHQSIRTLLSASPVFWENTTVSAIKGPCAILKEGVNSF